MPFIQLIVSSIIPNWPLLERRSRAKIESVVIAHVKSAIALAPFHVRLGVTVLSFFVGVLLLFVSVGAGDQLAAQSRAECLYTLLQRLPGPMASVIRLYRSIALLAFYEHPEVAKLLMITEKHER